MPEGESELFGGGLTSKAKRRVFTVSEITQDIKLVLESAFGELWVEGEISNFTAASSGHFYFTLKDDSATLSAVMFARANSSLKFKLENGLKVICFGKISIYPPRGQYQLIAEEIEPKGVGSLQLALEQLKKKLQKEGLFAEEHKRPIPYLPARVGVVTSLQGAAIKDILKVLKRRFADMRVVIAPVQVQGESAKDEIAGAIKDFNRWNDSAPRDERIEVLIVGRGGGSIEDLWAFNEEVVARAIYHSQIPVISAVGHEKDVVISDLVADLRAPTPSAAAEIVAPAKEELKMKLEDASGDLSRAFSETVLGLKERVLNLLSHLQKDMDSSLRLNAAELDAAKKKLSLLNPSSRIEQHIKQLENLARLVFIRAEHFVSLRKSRFGGIAEKLSALSPLNILSRGYSITFKVADGAVVKEAVALKAGDSIKTRLHKGEVISKVTDVKL